MRKLWIKVLENRIEVLMSSVSQNDILLKADIKSKSIRRSDVNILGEGFLNTSKMSQDIRGMFTLMNSRDDSLQSGDSTNVTSQEFALYMSQIVLSQPALT